MRAAEANRPATRPARDLATALEQMMKTRHAKLCQRSIACTVDRGVLSADTFTDANCLEAIEIILDTAIENSPVDSEVLVTIVRTDRHFVEIEIADSGEEAPRGERLPIRIKRAERLVQGQGGQLEI
jgi:signal transduction histidine kinase